MRGVGMLLALGACCSAAAACKLSKLQNVFRLGDVEYDLANGVIRLLREDDCSKANLAYWASGTGTPVSVVDIRYTTTASPHKS